MLVLGLENPFQGSGVLLQRWHEIQRKEVPESMSVPHLIAGYI